MDNKSSSEVIIANLKSSIESIFEELKQIQLSPKKINNSDSFEKLEMDIHAKATKLADLLSAVKLQETLNSPELDEVEKDLIKSSKKK